MRIMELGYDEDHFKITQLFENTCVRTTGLFLFSL